MSDEIKLPEPAFRLRWDRASASYRVSKPNIGDTDVYTAEQVRALLADALAQPQAPEQQRSMLSMGRPMTFGGCPFCGSQQCVAGQCQHAAPEQQAPQRTREREIAVMDGYRASATDAYFNARPHIDSFECRRVYEAGYLQGWDDYPLGRPASTAKVMAESLGSSSGEIEQALAHEFTHLNCPHCGGSGHVDDAKERLRGKDGKVHPTIQTMIDDMNGEIEG